MSHPLLSIIIPTLNEEKYLPKLLESIKKQDFNDYEIIIVDSNSKDNTVKIAKYFNCRVVMTEKKSIGYARNLGVDISRGKLILFLDADIILENNLLKRAIEIYQKNDIGALGFYIKPQEKTLFYKGLCGIINTMLFIFQFFSPHVSYAILTTKNLHDKAGGFIVRKVFREDHDYVSKISKIKRIRILYGKRILVSMRRYEADGKLRVLGKYLITELYALLKIRIPLNKLNYKFGKF